MINFADVVVGLAWGDESKGKISAQLASKKNDDGSSYYSCVARWAGGNNAGHTVWVKGEKYKTHLIPSGVFYGVKSIIGPDCVLHPDSFMEEIGYLDDNGFDSSLVKVSPKCHIVTNKHIQYDKENLSESLGTTSKGIAPCYADKSARVGILAKNVLDDKYIWDESLEGNILCEGAQGFWLDINMGTYPFVTSSTTLPYGACSIGFPAQKIRDVWGAAKIYDTRSGEDPLFPKSLFENKALSKLGELGEEYGVTTGRRRKVNWLDLDRLIYSINVSGTTKLVISKCDVIEELSIFRCFYKGAIVRFFNIESMKEFIKNEVEKRCSMVREIVYSSSPKEI